MQRHQNLSLTSIFDSSSLQEEGWCVKADANEPNTLSNIIVGLDQMLGSFAQVMKLQFLRKLLEIMLDEV